MTYQKFSEIFMFCPNFALIFARPQKCWGGGTRAPPPPGPYAYAAVRSEVLLFSVVFKFVAMIIGILGNMTVIIYAIFTNKEKIATSYLVGNLALADLLVCLTFIPIWIIEFILTILNIDSEHNLFCKSSRSTIFSLLFASVATRTYFSPLLLIVIYIL